MSVLPCSKGRLTLTSDGPVVTIGAERLGPGGVGAVAARAVLPRLVLLHNGWPLTSYRLARRETV